MSVLCSKCIYLRYHIHLYGPLRRNKSEECDARIHHTHIYTRTFAHTYSHMPNVMVVVVINSTVHFSTYRQFSSYMTKYIVTFFSFFWMRFSLGHFVVACAWQTWFIFPIWVFSTHSSFLFLFLSYSFIWCQINQFNAPLNLSTQQNRFRCCYRFCCILCSLFQAIKYDFFLIQHKVFRLANENMSIYII